MQRIIALPRKFFLSFKALPQKKQYIEFITAILSVPVLITVIILNFNSLKNMNTQKNDNTQQQSKNIFIPITSNEKNPVANPTTQQQSTTQEPCKKEIGPISITSPDEGDTVTDNPVFVDISYDQGDYCAVVWSYRINGGSWSDYDDNSIALYNPPQGKVKVEVRIKSIVTSDDQTLTRNFTYKGGSSAVTPSLIPSSAQGVQGASTSAH